MGYDCKILADSISPNGDRLTSFEVTFPRIVLAEVNTHRMISRNSASSRAIPVKKRIDAVIADPFIPTEFGRNKKGMQHDDVLDENADRLARTCWAQARTSAIDCAQMLAEIGVHKQLANRVLEPFAWHTAVLTATDWDNFFHLHVNLAAQGEFRRAAEMMQELYEKSEPHPVNYGDWHTPYVDGTEAFDVDVRARALVQANSIDGQQGQLVKASISAARCARVSYLTQDGTRDFSEDLALFDRLVGPGHLSPLEHPARPMYPGEIDLFRTIRYEWDAPCGWFTAVGAASYLGNYNGWVQLRKLIPGERDILGHRARPGGA